MYTLDLNAYRKWAKKHHRAAIIQAAQVHVTSQIIVSEVTAERMCKVVQEGNIDNWAFVPITLLTPNPEPRFRIQRSDSAALHDDSANNTVEVTGIPAEFAYLSPILTDADFKFIGISIGSVRITIERA